MGRPKGFNIKNFSKYNLLHTEKTEMLSGVLFNTLYPIKKTAQYYLSCEVWAYCASNFKRKIKNIDLSVNIDVLTDEKSNDFLKEKCRDDKWIKEDELEAINFLKKIYPTHNYKYFYELSNIFGLYINGNLTGYRNKDKVNRYSHKFNNFIGVKNKVPYLMNLYNKSSEYSKEKIGDAYCKKKSSELFEAYYYAEAEYVIENHDLSDVFLNLGTHGVCLPMGFTNSSAEWFKEKYGKTCGYAHVGEVFFVVTNDTIYFDIKRHY